METEIFKLTLGAILRHFFSIVAGMLAPYGVNEAMQGKLVEATVVLSISVILSLGAFIWSYFQKRFQQAIQQEALSAQPDTPMSLVQASAAQNTAGTKF